MTITDDFKTEVKDFCGISGTDSDSIVNPLITMADEYLKSAIGDEYPENEKSKTLIKVITNDFYSNRDYMESNKVSVNARKLVESIILQLKMELAIAESMVVESDI